MCLARVPRDVWTHEIAPQRTVRAALACTSKDMFALLRAQASERPLIWPRNALWQAIRDDAVARVKQLLKMRRRQWLKKRELAFAATHDARAVLEVCVQDHRDVALVALRRGNKALFCVYCETIDWKNVRKRYMINSYEQVGLDERRRLCLYDCMTALVAAEKLDFLMWLKETHWASCTTFMDKTIPACALQRGNMPLYTFLGASYGYRHQARMHVAKGRMWTLLEQMERDVGFGEIGVRYDTLVMAVANDPTLVLPARWDAVARASVGHSGAPVFALVATRQHARIEALHAMGTIVEYKWLFRAAIVHQNEHVLAWLAVLGDRAWKDGVTKAMQHYCDLRVAICNYTDDLRASRFVWIWAWMRAHWM
jgi:hypothetical protein